MTDDKIKWTFRPIQWDGPQTPPRQRRSRWTFKAGITETYALLSAELKHLEAKLCVIEADFREQDIKLDGFPRANAPVPKFPGVRIAFESKHGPLIYATDTHETWEHNVRAIALSLQALRSVDRYGVTKNAEQYRGWKAIGTGYEVPSMSIADAARFISDHSYETKFMWPTFTPEQIMGDTTRARQAYRSALRNLHPDHGGTDLEKFTKLLAAGKVLGL